MVVYKEGSSEGLGHACLPWKVSAAVHQGPRARREGGGTQGRRQVPLRSSTVTCFIRCQTFWEQFCGIKSSKVRNVSIFNGDFLKESLIYIKNDINNFHIEFGGRKNAK